MNISSIPLHLHEVRSLSELPLEKLIQIKLSFAKQSPNINNAGSEGRMLSTISLPKSMPLRRMGSKSIRRYEDWGEKNKDSKISKIFQLTVTALSFLAFGGYLLTLIITAIRRGQNATTPPNLIVLSDLQNLQKMKRPKRGLFIHDSEENEYDTERFYRCMIMISTELQSYYY
ncbi:PREDICTED: uncharacterized protein LOC105359970 [Ceratosolen solmsi marchali]|uniref:Uncharacterized protein LOC105359970 n=1 Tax=Ceratosolen solmsi marchali TaxID=326594 RepID=A0AAJ6YCD3_9HYME|nr:PREDICTED: uncharacterized protein LOC105359970 [Ceratosolen solmsi marchali]